MRTLSLLVVLPLAACSFQSDASPPSGKESGPSTTRSFAITDFTTVALRGSDDVDVRIGTGFSVRATGPRAELDRLDIVREGNTLRIDRKQTPGYGWSGKHDPVKVFVTMPRIVAAQIVGSGNMAIDRTDGSRFDGTAAGSGNLSIAALVVPQAKLAIAGSGNIAAAGSVERLTIESAASGNVAARGLRARGATVSLVGSGDVVADVNGAADVSLVGSGTVDLGKAAHCTTSKVGSGEVRCGG
ncbi:head GIN domain-containing protein [Sphingomonas sp. PAMC 26605]|uniref:head GIN domain-containing protein n=1 Tax=Sphingomonas sp. PAMC 26605 TaxID=1112214 RepID=UPI00026CA686|nr:head GIN domain-containing protein [Sphingomonas sp. PAMC 26605]